jgi:hypothetical protein
MVECAMTNDQAPMTNRLSAVIHAAFTWTVPPPKRLANRLALLTSIAFALNGAVVASVEAQLESRLALMRAAGDPASIGDLAPAPIPDDQNAAAILERIGPRLDEFSNDHARFLRTPIGQSYEQAQDRGEPVTPEHIFEIRLILLEYDDVEDALAQAAKCDKYASLLDYSLDYANFIDAAIGTQGNVRIAGRFLNWRTEVLVNDGFHDDAVENGIKTLRLARLYEHEPTIVPLLVGNAMRNLSVPYMYDTLSSGPVSSKLHAALDAELALIDTPQRLLHALKSERAVCADATDAYLPWYPLMPVACGWLLDSEQWGLLDEIDAHLQMAEMPWHEVRSGFVPPDAPAPPSKRGKLADALLPGLQAVFHAHARTLAAMRSLRIYNALREFSGKHGREANGLQELGLPAAATIDPYSGGPLKLKHTDEGWVVYSVMENGVDDDGDFMGRKDFGVAPRKLRLTE